MRRLLLSVALAGTLAGTGFTPGGALAQSSSFAPVVYVNNSAVTRYEIDQRMRFMALLGQAAPPAEVEKLLIEDRLRIEATKRAGMKITDEQVQAGLEEFASRANMTADQFTAALASAGVERQAYRDFVAAGVAWREFVRERFVPQVNVSDAEVDREMTRVIETPRIEQVLISELIIPAPQGQEAQAEALANRIRGSVSNETEFAQAARQHSAAGTRGQGGRLQWMPLDNLPPTLRPILTALRPGQVSAPLPVPGAVVLLYMRDQRGGLRPGAKDQVLDVARMMLPDAQTAANVTARVDTCDDLFTQARRLGGVAVSRDTLPQSAIAQDIALRLASLDANESAQIQRANGVELVMLCKRTPALLVDVGSEKAPVVAAEGGQTPPDPNALPDRNSVREAIFNRKVAALADAHLAELRADAVIRRP